MGSIRNFFLSLFVVSLAPSVAQAALNIPLTVTMSEAVTVNTAGGTPRIPVDVGGNTRYATYTSGSGTSALTFTLTPTAGDVDLDGISVSSPIDLNGGTIKDLSGNNTALTFTSPNTSGIKVDYPSLSMDFINSDYILSGTHYATLSSFLSAAGGSFTRSGSATYFDSSGTLQTVGADTPRFDYDPITHAAKGILIEESRTNYVGKSSEFDHSSWTKTGVTVTADVAVAPDGTMTADLVNPTGAAFTSIASTSSIPFVAGDRVSRSIYAKIGVGTKIWFEHSDNGVYGSTVYDLSTETVTPSGGTTASMTPVGNGWYRLNWSRQFTSSSASSSAGKMYIDGYGSGPSGHYLYLWGAQTEIGGSPTSYIPTTTAAVTRAADRLSMPTGGWFNNSTLSAFADFQQPSLNGTTAYPTTWSVNAGTSGNEIMNFVATGSGSVVFKNTTGGVTQYQLNSGILSLPNQIRQGSTLDSAGASSSRNGSAAAHATGSIPSGLSTMNIGMSYAANWLNGTIKVFKYYPLRLSDAQLQLLTQ